MLTIAQKVKVLGAYTIKINDIGRPFNIRRRVTGAELGVTYVFKNDKVMREENMYPVGHSEDSPMFQCLDCGKLTLKETDDACPACFYPSERYLKRALEGYNPCPA